jgi:hypothetical protein
MELWNSQARKIVETYYETYLLSLKYILGYSVEGHNLADDYLNSDNESCKQAANQYKEMNLNPTITKDIYRTFVNALAKLGELRRGFYCILCDANTQSRLKDYWASTNLFYRDRVYFN